MQKHNLSINKLSKLTDISRPALTALMDGKSKGIQFETLSTLLHFFNINIGDLLVDDRGHILLSVIPYQKVKSPFVELDISAAKEKGLEDLYKNNTVSLELLVTDEQILYDVPLIVQIVHNKDTHELLYASIDSVKLPKDTYSEKASSAISKLISDTSDTFKASLMHYILKNTPSTEIQDFLKAPTMKPVMINLAGESTISFFDDSSERSATELDFSKDNLFIAEDATDYEKSFVFVTNDLTEMRPED